MISETQIPQKYLNLIQEQIDIYETDRSIQIVNNIPDTVDIPIEKPNHWLRVPDIICVFVDMANSTRLSAEKYDKSTAGAYQLFTGTAIKIFHGCNAQYIDVKGDGVFALYNSNQSYTALAAAIIFKTFAEEVFVPIIGSNTKVQIGCHIGIDQNTVLVRKIGLKRVEGRTDRQNEVWAGKPVNMAAKLASKTQHGELLVSDRYFANIQNELILQSCGCPNGLKADLWSAIDLSSEDHFDFNTGYMLKSAWCEIHGLQYCETIMKLDK